MATFSRNFEQTLRRALALAAERQHEYVVLEHLLLALLDDQDAAAVLLACKADLKTLRDNLETYLENDLDNIISPLMGGAEPRPSAGFQRVMQRALRHAESNNAREASGAGALVALFSERESHAAYFLQEQDVTRYAAINFISNAAPKSPRGDALKRNLSAALKELYPAQPASVEDVILLHERIAQLEELLSAATARIDHMENTLSAKRDGDSASSL